MMGFTQKVIFERIRKEKRFLKKSGIKRIGLFGSAARGTDRKGSDLDFVVEMAPVTFDGYMDVKFRLEALFHKRVDLVLARRIKPALLGKIRAETIDVPGF